MLAQSVLFIARPALLQDVLPQLKQAGLQVSLAETLQGALKEISKSGPGLVVAEPGLQGFNVADLLSRLESEPDSPPVIVLSERGTAEEARGLMELGAKDYWLAPLTWEKLKTQLEAVGAGGRGEPGRASSAGREIIGEHPAMRRVLTLARQVAPSTATVLISGASGTGKELFARYIHRHSQRSGKPFVAVNCAALPEHLLESELFGHEKGAFTGAVQKKPGKFELASTGTLLLDEISEMDLSLQAKLLRAIQEGEIDRVGGMESVRVDVRIICTTNRDLQEAVDRGAFRQDLFYRLNVIPLRLPSLQERPEDIPILAGHFIDSFCKQYGVQRLELTPPARTWLQEHDWPGNVRELQNLMERAVLLAGRGPIEKGHFLLDSDDLDWEGLEGSGPAGEVEQDEAPTPSGEAEPPVSTLAEMEKRLIKRSLENTSGNRTQAAKLLGISVRTLRNKLNEYRKQGDAL